MTFQPALHPALLLLLLAPVMAAAVWGLVRARGTGSRLRWVGRVTLTLLCVIVLLRPGIPGGENRTLTTDVDVFLLVDRTASIIAEDWGDGEPRLDGVRADVQAVIAQYPGARFSLITWDRDVAVRVPLTTDTTAVASAMEVLTPEITMQSDGTTISLANTQLQRSLERAAEAQPDRARLVFYFGDGEQTSASTPGSFAGSAALVSGGTVFGYGTTAGGRMRSTEGWGSADDAPYITYNGQDAVSVIDEDLLRNIAEQLGVPYEHRSAGVAPALPDVPPTAVTLSESGTTGSSFELYWFAAAGIVVLLGVELAFATAAAVRIGRGSKPRRLVGGSS